MARRNRSGETVIMGGRIADGEPATGNETTPDEMEEDRTMILPDPLLAGTEESEEEGETAGAAEDEQVSAEAGGDEASELARLREEHEALVNEVTVWRNIQDAAARDPAGTLAALARNLLTEQGMMDQFASHLGLSGRHSASDGARSDFRPGDFAPATDLEEALLQHWGEENWKFVKEGPERMRQMAARLDEQEHQGRYLSSLYLEHLALQEGMRALMDALEMSHDVRFDPAEFEAHWAKNPTMKPEDVVRAIYGEKVRQALKVKRQQTKPRPSTLQMGSGTGNGTQRRSARGHFANAWDSATEELQRLGLL